VDLLIKPSKTEGFGMSGLRAIAADLPVLISENCGLGIALKRLPFGDMYVVDSQDPQVWAERIKEIKEKDVEICHSEVEQLKKEYIKEYMWENQFNSVVAEFVKMFPSSDGRERPYVEENVSGGEKIKSGIQETNQGEEDDI